MSVMAGLSASPGRRGGAGIRLAAVVVAAVLVPLAGCGDDADEHRVPREAVHQVAHVPRAELASGGSVTWGVDELPATLNAYDEAATDVTVHVAQAVMPMLFTLDDQGRPRRNPDYLRAAEVTAREPRQQVVYTLHPKAAWSDGRPIDADDFRAQWRALGGEAGGEPVAGYDRVAKVTEGPGRHQVTVTFARPYADWRSLFSPLYPRAVSEAMVKGDTPAGGTEDGKGGDESPPSAGPFAVAEVDRRARTITLKRNARWWGEPALLEELVFAAVPRAERPAALRAGDLDVAEVAPQDAGRLGEAAVYRAYAAGYTQLTMNGDAPKLRDERVRWGLARAVDRAALAEAVHEPAGLPALPLGSHLRTVGHADYEDTSDALGDSGREAAAALLADAGWELTDPDDVVDADGSAGPDAGGKDGGGKDGGGKDGGEDDRGGGHEHRDDGDAGGAAGDAADAPRAAHPADAPVRVRKGEPLQLRLLVPTGPGADHLKTTGRRVVDMLAEVGVHADLTEVPAEEFFADRLPGGDFDLALFSWPATSFPATDAHPLFAKPDPATAGATAVSGQNYARLGTDHIDQLLTQAAAELDADAQAELLTQADERLWAVAGSIPLYQPPQVVAARDDLSGVGAFGLATPRYQDIGYRART